MFNLMCSKERVCVCVCLRLCVCMWDYVCVRMLFLDVVGEGCRLVVGGNREQVSTETMADSWAGAELNLLLLAQS